MEDGRGGPCSCSTTSSKPSPTPQTQFTEGLKGRSKDTESASPEKKDMWDVYAGTWCFRFSQIVKPRRHLLHPYLFTSRKPRSASLGRTPICSSTQKKKKQFSVRRNTKNFAPCTMEKPRTKGIHQQLDDVIYYGQCKLWPDHESQHWECALHTLSNQSVKKIDLEDQHPSSISVQSDGLCAN